MDGPQGDYALWNESNRKRQKSWFYSYVEYKTIKEKKKKNNQQNKLIGMDNRLVVTRREGCWGWGQKWVNEVKCVMRDGNQTCGGKHTVQIANHSYTPEIYIMS